VILVSRDEAYAVLTGVTVAEVTSTVRGIRSEVPVGRQEGLKQRSVVNTDNLHTLPKRLLIERIGHLGRAKVEALDSAIRYSLALAGAEGTGRH
jgi:mRNA interferase MazF